MPMLSRFVLRVKSQSNLTQHFNTQLPVTLGLLVSWMNWLFFEVPWVSSKFQWNKNRWAHSPNPNTGLQISRKNPRDTNWGDPSPSRKNSGFQIWLECGAGEQRSGSTGRNFSKRIWKKRLWFVKTWGFKRSYWPSDLYWFSFKHMWHMWMIRRLCILWFFFGVFQLQRMSRLNIWFCKKSCEFVWGDYPDIHSCEQLGLDLDREGLPYYCVCAPGYIAICGCHLSVMNWTQNMLLCPQDW